MAHIAANDSQIWIGSNSTDLQTGIYRLLNISSNQTEYFQDTSFNLSHTDARNVSSSRQLWQVALISLGAIVFIALTIAGNVLVLASFKVEIKLQIISNYFLLSLAVADLMIGLVSMPLYAMLLIVGEWPLGPIVCDIWLCIDYTMCSASVASLLIICFDRFMSVKRPLHYRAWRTGRNVRVMIAIAWAVSFLLWTPWIISWPYIAGERTVLDNECYIQFLGKQHLASNQIITLVTSIITFYLPVTVMGVLYFIVFLETRRQFPEKLHAGNNLTIKTPIQQPEDLVFSQNSHENDKTEENSCKERVLDCIGICCEVHGRDDEHDSSDLSLTHTSGYKHGHANNWDNLSLNSNRQTSSIPSFSAFLNRAFSRENVKNESRDFTEIVERLTTSFSERTPSPEPTTLNNHIAARSKGSHKLFSNTLTQYNVKPDLGPTPLIAAAGSSSSTEDRGDCSPISNKEHEQNESQVPQKAATQRQIQGHEKRQKSKAAKTISAISLAFILTWSPYMVFTVINAFNENIIPDILYKIGYWLCYLNSTVNPLCYALCNITFRQTFLKIITCKVKQKRRVDLITT
ncbi:muscarinic acetylcholine receptor M1-like [Watersipora subatra]|uniref:muscarinic acetylcholine receptor M1-like n=1 Tax=Watersipora subatra TaxID=2589382 RepID=UPI00355AE782